MFATLLIAAIFMSVMPVIAAPPAPAMWPMPATLSFNTDTANIGDKFNVTIHIATTGPSYTWQCKVNFNAAQITAVRADYTGSGKSLFFTPKGSIPVSAIIDNTAGFVSHGESLVGSDSAAATTDSTLFWIEFAIKTAPPSGSLTSQISVEDPAGGNTFILDPDLNTVPNSVGSATYTFTWSAPPPPTLSVSPNQNLFDDNTQHYTGTTFTDDIVVNINGAWNLRSLSTHLAYDSTLLSVTSVTFEPIWGTTNSVNNPGDLTITVSDPTSTPGGNVVIAHVTFTILIQGAVPPDPAGSFDQTTLNLNNYALANPDGPITPVSEVDGYVRVAAFLFLAPPQLVVSDATMGPGAALGKLFNVTVTLKDLSDGWRLIGVQFRLKYPTALIEPVAVYEGPFFPYWANQQEDSLGTFWVSYLETNGGYGPHVLAGDMILPNSTGAWHPPAASGTGVIATITFKVICQPIAESIGESATTAPLGIVEQLAIGLDNFDSQNVVAVPLAAPQNGTYTIYPILPGRIIDIYGGAVNSGYGPIGNGTYLAFPAPYGGQGPDEPMDLVEEQSQVYFNANVTYNLYPVQNKLVGFQINYPDGTLYANLFALSDENGVATITFRMPWPSQNPESLFGVWHVYVSVQLADIFINDTLAFHYDYKVRIWKVTTDKPQYIHGDTVNVAVKYGSHAQQYYPILMKIAIMDELGVVIGHFEIATQVGGTVFCQYKDATLTGNIFIPKWAYAGIATVHVNIFDKEPINGGAPWTPEFKPAPTIYILPQ